MSYSTSGLVETVLNNQAASDPTGTDDSSQGYSIESRWVNTSSGAEFVCVDASVGSAVWKETTGGITGDFVPSGGIARTYHVAKTGTPYSDIGAAITQAVTDGIGTDRVDIVVHPGLYTETSTIDVPGNVCVRGVSKGVARLINSTTDYFRCTGANTFFEDLLFEGNGAAATWCINANNQNGVHIRRVDLLNNGGTSTQGFVTQAGATWAVLFIEDCIVDSYKTTGDVVFLDNTSGTSRFVDVIINNVFFDNFFGGDLIRIEGCQDVRIRNSTLRTDVGIMVDLQTGGATGTPFVKISNSWLGTSPGSTLGVPVEIGSSCSMEIFDTYWDPTASTLTGNLVDNSWKTGGIGTWYYSADTTPDTAGEMYANTISTTTTTQLILFQDDFYGNRQREMLENTPAGSYLMVKGLDANTGSSAIWKISSTEQVSTDRVQIDFTGTATNFVGTTIWADISHWQLYIIPGADLGMPLQYEFDSSTFATDPGSGAFRLDTADAGTASNLYINTANANGHGLFAILHDADIIGEGSQIVIVNQVDQTQSARFWVNGPTVDNTGWVTIPVDNTKDSRSTNWVFPSDGVPFAIYIYPANGHRFVERSDHFYTPTAGFGEIWVKDNTDPSAVASTLWFTDDAGNDIRLGADSYISSNASTATAAADPGPGTFRFNNSAAGSATEIYISTGDVHGLGYGNIWFKSLNAGSQMIFIREDYPNDRFRFWVTGVTDNTGWATISVDNTKDAQSPAWSGLKNGERYIIALFSNVGDIEGGINPMDATFFSERADHVNTPAAGFAELWVRNDAPTSLIFTDDAGTDHLLNKPSKVSLASNETIATDATEIVIGGGYIDGGTGGTYSWEMLGTYNDGGGGGVQDIEIRLYDMGADGSPTAGTLRSVLEITSLDTLDRVSLGLTASASPGVDTDTIQDAARMYEVRAYLDATGGLDSAKILNVVFVES